MDKDPELQAMGSISNALENLDEDERARVMQWVCSRFDIAPLQGQGNKPTGNGPPDDPDPEDNGANDEFSSFADLYDKANPSTDPDRALIGGYWLQVVKGNEDFVSQSVNGELKNLGHGVTNITAALTSLTNAKPRLTMQVRKSGSSQQARKKYKLTQEGIKRVSQLLSSE